MGAVVVLIGLAILFLLLALVIKAVKFLLFVALILFLVGLVRGWTARKSRS